MRLAFTPKLKLSRANVEKLFRINRIIDSYTEQGYRLTLRQLYYQLVSKNVIPNNVKEYVKLGDLLTKGRMAGVVDWDGIEDRVRSPRIPYSCDDTDDAINDTINQYRLDRQRDQDKYIELWVEKDALSNVLSRKTYYYHIRLMVNRGYSSTTAMYDAYNRILPRLAKGQSCHILYLGDHDPSGLDMIRDINERLVVMLYNQPQEIADYVENEMDIDDFKALEQEYIDEPFCYVEDYEGEIEFSPIIAYIHKNFSIRHIGLTKEQIDQYNPPPNPAKITDPRAKDYIAAHGKISWEVDALEPSVLHEIIDSNILDLIDKKKFDTLLKQEDADKTKLATVLPKADTVDEIQLMFEDFEMPKRIPKDAKELITAIKELVCK